jgi:uncharacterized protein (UPF0333 family)
MKIIAEKNGQISAELILILSTMTLIVLITAFYTTNILNDITNHTQEVIKEGREMILSQL